MKVIKRESLYIPIKDVTREQRERIIEKLTFHFVAKESICEECEFVAERYSDVCERCANYKGGYVLAKNAIVGENKYLKMPVGSGFRVLREMHLTDYTLVDKSPDRPIKPFRFTGTLKEGQNECVESMMRMKRGVLKAPPRSGKCVDGSTMISTSKGLIRIDSLFEGVSLPTDGDYTMSAPKGLTVHTADGFRRVSKLYSKVVDETVKITTSTGKSLVGTPNHPVRVARATGLEWVPMAELKNGDFVVSNRADGWGGNGNALLKDPHSVDARIKPGTINLVIGQVPKTMTVHLARVLGFLTADGRCGNHPSLSFCNSHQYKLDAFKESWEHCFPDYPLRESVDPDRTTSLWVSCAYVRFFLEARCGWALKNAGEKQIPSVLLGLDKKFILAYIGAYLSCDSEQSKTVVNIGSASFKLMRQLSTVLSTFGIRNHVATEPIPIELDHVTKGKRTGMYGNIKIKRNYFDTLVDLMGSSFIRPIEERDPRLLLQGDVIPNLRSILKDTEEHYQVREGQKYYYESRGKRFPYERLVLDSRGRGRSPNLNRLVAIKEVGSELNVVANTPPLEFLNKKTAGIVHELMDESIGFEEVVKTSVRKKPTRVYDLVVPSNTQFFGNGLLCHNTVMLTVLASQIGQKTLILASQHDWLLGFKETFVGSNTQDALTNLNPKRIKLCKTLEDFKTHDICLATVQTFYSPGGEKLLAKIRSMFGLILIDEVQSAAADKYVHIVAQLNATYAIGCSGTPQRKDMKEVLVDNVLGPVFHEMKTERVRPTIRLTRTGYSKHYKGQVLWTRIVSAMENDKTRHRTIAKQVLADVKDGHMILLPCAQIKPMRSLITLINKLAGKTLAYEFSGAKKAEREELVQRARDYKVKVLVGTQKVISVGVNIPRASALYETVLSSNMPNAQQRMARVLTPMEGKPPPIVRYFLDDFTIRKNCMRAEYFGVMKPIFKPIISERDNAMLMEYFKNTKSMERKFDL